MRASKLDDHVATIASLLDNGASQSSIAERYGVARSTLQNFIETRLNAIEPDWANDNLSEEPDDTYTEIPVFVRDYSDQSELYVYPLGDVHKGASAHNRDRWREWLGYLQDTPAATMLGTGDFFNAAIKGSVSETYDEALTVQKAREELTAELRPLAEAGRVDLLMPGNHEDRIYRAVGDCPVSAIAGTLGTNYARVGCGLIYIVGDVVYEFFVKHGTGGGQVGARANRLARQADAVESDVYVSGHTHSQLVFPRDKFVLNRRTARYERKRQVFISSGSFLNYEEYAFKAGYVPQKIGAPRIRLDGRRKDIHASI